MLRRRHGSFFNALLLLLLLRLLLRRQLFVCGKRFRMRRLQFPPRVRLCRSETTGQYHEYTPGPVARCARAILNAAAPRRLKKVLAGRVATGLERVERMEKEARWLKVHGSPLHVLGLPEHADLAEVKSRYTDLLFETHPDTAIAGTFGAVDAAVTRRASDMSLAQVDTAATAVAAARAEKDRAEAYQLLKEAHVMITTPDSVWHLNGSAPQILDVIQPPTSLLSRVATPVRVVASVSNLLMAAVACLIIFVVSPGAFQMLLEKLDPALHAWTQQAKAEDDAREAQGVAVDRDDVTRFASPKVQRMLKPGKAVQRIQEVSASAVDDDVGAAVRAAVSLDLGRKAA